MAEQRALWVSTSTRTRGGIASYVRAMRQTPLWEDWNIRHVTTHRDGSAAVKIAVFALGALQFVVELIRFRPDVIHLHASTRGSFVRKAILFWINRIVGTPVVLHMHGSGFPEDYERSPRAVRALTRATLRRAGAFVALGQVWADRMREITPDARILAIPNGVRLAPRTAQPSGEPVTVVFLGRIGDHKGTFRLLDAWAKLVCEPGFADSATLTIAGDGEVARAREYVRELCLQDTVTVHGWLSEEEVGDLLGHAHVLVLPSRNEGQPMAVLEAMARGLCVIAGNVGGLPEMLGSDGGILIPPDDAEAIAAALLPVVHDGELRTRYGAAAHARVRDQFDTRAVARRLDALYREVCA
ncbi:glycosyltransferase family 4 protein [Mycobacterium sp. NAZ190054]|uniref:glycosyltransferase family 4 protein n=1 Tax=Mycobacterium sp. NAZ190054 TaxID=1747766 RepID=UPI00079CA2B8|nr:glycosyltransferase family 4 protein [Mycobacterium sp. NAZ190054]KWX66504.1 glycosyl transferase [Mycobacterium sp. NAZ190054]